MNTRGMYRLRRTGQQRNRYAHDGRQAPGRLYQYTVEHMVGGVLGYFVGYGWGRNQAEALADWRRQSGKAEEGA